MSPGSDARIAFEDSVFVDATIVHGMASDPKFLPAWLQDAKLNLRAAADELAHLGQPGQAAATIQRGALRPH